MDDIPAQLMILVDFDGVLNPSFRCNPPYCRHIEHRGWIRRRVWSQQASRDVVVLLNPDHGAWLRKLAAETGAQLAWATKWGDDIHFQCSEVLGLRRLPVVPGLSIMMGEPKARHIQAFTQGRRFAYFDDDEYELAAVRELMPEAHAIHVPENRGLLPSHVDDAQAYLSAH